MTDDTTRGRGTAPKQRNLFEQDARQAADAEQERQPRAVSDIIAEWRRVYLADYERRKQAGELPERIMQNIREIERHRRGDD